MPHRAQLVVLQPFGFGHRGELLDRLCGRLFAVRRVNHLKPALFDRQAVGAFL